MKGAIFALIFITGVNNAFSRILDKCQLVNELRQQGFPEDQLANWVCLVDAESSGNTAALGHGNADGSTDWGLFQINDRYWCTVGYPGNGCDVDCNALVTDDITEASKCAQLIYSQNGFQAWVGWNNKCNGQPLPDISDC